MMAPSLLGRTMSDDLLGQILSSVLGNAGGGRQGSPDDLGAGLGGLGGGLGGLGGLGGALGGIFGRNDETQSGPAAGGSPFGGKGALIAVLLPMAMQWVQRNGGLGAVLSRFQQQGHSQAVASWVSTGDNEPMSADAVGEVVGMEELSRISQQLGVSQDEVASGFAQILPQVVNQLTPAGGVPDDADDTLQSGLLALEQLLGRR